MILEQALPWQFETATIDALEISMEGRQDPTDLTTHMEFQILDQKKISPGAADFIKTGVVLVQAEDALIAHIVERQVIGYKPVMNFMGIHQVTQRRNIGRVQDTPTIIINLRQIMCPKKMHNQLLGF
jgi:hypothetical protein